MIIWVYYCGRYCLQALEGLECECVSCFSIYRVTSNEKILRGNFYTPKRTKSGIIFVHVDVQGKNHLMAHTVTVRYCDVTTSTS